MAATEARVGPPALRDGAEPQAMLNTARAWRPHPREVDAQQLPIVLGASAIDTNHRPREVGVADAPTSSPSCPAKVSEIAIGIPFLINKFSKTPC